MSKQKITSFFKPVSTKRVSSEPPELDVSAKKPKLETCEEKDVTKDVKKELHEDFQNSKSPISSEKVKAEESPEVPDNKDVKENLKTESETVSVKDATTKLEDSTKESDDVNSDSKRMENDQCTKREEVKDPEEKKDMNSTEVLKDVTSESENKSNFTTPVKTENKSMFVSTPLGMLSPLQCLARIKSQCCKTPALHHSIGSTWYFALQSEFNKPYFTKLSQFIVEERKRFTIYPPEHQVWTWTTLCPMKDIKVVILGQDPYHNPRQAHGLCFSVQNGVPPPPSLVNMYKELENDIPGFKAPSHGNLTGWAQQGVLLLNACLTVRANSPNSHKDKGWEQLTDAVIKRLSDTGNGIVFLLWGSYAQKKGAVVNKKKHHILQTTHPSPLSAHRGFLGCKHFSQCNALLKKSGKKPIDWSRLPLV